MSFDEIFDLTAGLYFNFYNIQKNEMKRGARGVEQYIGRLTESQADRQKTEQTAAVGSFTSSYSNIVTVTRQDPTYVVVFFLWQHF